MRRYSNSGRCKKYGWYKYRFNGVLKAYRVKMFIYSLFMKIFSDKSVKINRTTEKMW